MIHRNSLHIDWINKASTKNNKADKILVEKVIRALFLLEGLIDHKLEFVFKGGTALMLILNSSKRLSIDIDIIIEKEPANLLMIFERLIADKIFTRFELHERKTSSEIQKAHYKFFYEPTHKTIGREESILLDILFDTASYGRINKVPIKSNFVISEGDPLKVMVPSAEDILGDKLTAYAPNTTGIPYFKGSKSMSMEIIKQLYDVGNLVDIVEDGLLVRKTFEKFASTELGYRNLSEITIDQVLDDIFATSLCLVSRGVVGTGEFQHLQKGIQRISPFIFSEPFHIEKAIVHASKAAYISTVVKFQKDEIEKYKKSVDMGDWMIREPFWPKLNRLKKTNTEAFFYWYKAFKLHSEGASHL